MNNKKKLIIGIVLGIILVSGITYAILTWTSTRINLGITSDCFTIDYTKGGDITGSLKLLNEEDLITSDNKFTIKNGVGISSANIGINSSCNIEGYGSLYLNVTSISDAFTTGSSVGSLKYVVLKNTSSITNPREVSVTSLLNQSFDIEAKGIITSSGTKDILVRNLSNTEIYKYLIVIYIDNNLASNDVIGATFTGNISADAEQYKTSYNGLAKLIARDTFTPNTTVTNNGITYSYDTSNNLMEDVDGNIRYYGASPNNYIYFNCSDYSNQTSDTCETWRIIGVFDGKVKIMRNTLIGNLAWDQDKNIDSSLTTYDNDWSTASLQVLLNQKYYNGDTAGTVTYYSGSSGSTSLSLDMSSIGIKNDTTRNLISDTLYYLGGHSGSSVYSDQIYSYERGTKVYTGRPTTWTGNIAIPYPSDYGYAADLGSCTVQLESYNKSTCTSTNWMKNIITNNGNTWGWLLTPYSGNSSDAWPVRSVGYVFYYNSTCNAFGVAPVLYLGSEQEIESGTGTNSDPYRLSVS